MTFKETCNAICEEGYHIVGKQSLTCLQDGNWNSDTEPICASKGCF